MTISLVVRFFRRLFRSSDCCARKPPTLAVTDEATICAALSATLKQAGWELLIVNTLSAAVEIQQRQFCPVVLYDQHTGQDWREAIGRLSNLSPHPCVILISRQSDRNLLDEVARCGGADVLRTPLTTDVVRRVVESHFTIWRAQQMLRQNAFQRSSADKSLPDSVED
jgi:DNA-binding NtrC family response regulator